MVGCAGHTGLAWCVKSAQRSEFPTWQYPCNTSPSKATGKKPNTSGLSHSHPFPSLLLSSFDICCGFVHLMLFIQLWCLSHVCTWSCCLPCAACVPHQLQALPVPKADGPGSSCGAAHGTSWRGPHWGLCVTALPPQLVTVMILALQALSLILRVSCLASSCLPENTKGL